MTGLAPAGDRTLDDDARARFALTTSSAPTLGAEAVVLSPMPVIDEINEELRWTDPRVRVDDQSDFGVVVRGREIGTPYVGRVSVHGGEHCFGAYFAHAGSDTGRLDTLELGARVEAYLSPLSLAPGQKSTIVPARHFRVTLRASYKHSTGPAARATLRRIGCYPRA